MTHGGQQYTLQAFPRTVFGKAVRARRRAGRIPAIMYGHNQENVALEVEETAMRKVWQGAGNSALVDLAIEGREEPIEILIQAVAVEPVYGQMLHVDFHRIKLTEKLTTDIPLRYGGVAAAVKEQSGILVKNMDHLKVECLPTDLVSEIDVPLERLQTINDVITVGELPIPPGITVLAQAQEVVATVKPPRSEEELKALEEKPAEAAPEAVEVVKKKAKEGEESAPASESKEVAK